MLDYLCEERKTVYQVIIEAIWENEISSKKREKGGGQVREDRVEFLLTCSASPFILLSHPGFSTKHLSLLLVSLASQPLYKESGSDSTGLCNSALWT
jgi:hypothetical protein